MPTIFAELQRAGQAPESPMAERESRRGDHVSETLRQLAVEEDSLVNWPPVAGAALDANRDGIIRLQWCHGAAGDGAGRLPLP
jgi:hypothetical protein